MAAPKVLSVAAVSARQVGVCQSGEVKIDDGFQGLGRGAVLQGFRQCREPGSIFGLEHAQLSDGGTPTLGTAAAIGRSMRADRDGRRSGCRRTPGTVARLALGVAPLRDRRPASVLWACLWLSLRTHCSEVAAGLAPVGHSLLFAVGAGPPQDGVRRTRRLNLSGTWRYGRLRFSGSGHSTRSPRPSSPRERRGSALSGGNWNFSYPAACLPQRNSLPSAHMRCRITASLRATATRARAMPRRLAMLIPHARSADHLVLRISSEWAAS